VHKAIGDPLSILELMRVKTVRREIQVVVVGGGFGGLWAVQALRRADVSVVLVDRRNHHLFQPLLYQVATGGLSPADIASPLRGVLRHQGNVRVIKGEFEDVDPEAKMTRIDGVKIPYDFLILATGATHHYFGNEGWSSLAPGLKTVEDAISIRNHIFDVFEKAECEADDEQREALLTFVIVGGGPTGVEMAGAVGELARQTLRQDFRVINPRQSRILLAEAQDRILPSYPEDLSRKAVSALKRLGIEVHTNTLVSAIDQGSVTFKREGTETLIPARTVVWAAGLKASSVGEVLSERTGAKLDKFGRVVVEPDCSVAGYPEVFVIGDLACLEQDGTPLPGVAPVAMQQGEYVARAVRARLMGKPRDPFRYADKGRLAVIGRAAAVADFGRFRFSGYPAWLLWVFVHLMYLVGFENRLLVLLQWSWSYFTRNRSARLITGEEQWRRKAASRVEEVKKNPQSGLATGART
jgi:NADH dehydrogenase